MKKLLLLFLLAGPGVFAQNPIPGKPQTRAVALVGGTIHVGNGQVIENGILVFENGLIKTVGNAQTSFDRTATEVIDAAGKHVYPGLIAAASTVGLSEIASVRATVDNTETGQINPNVRALVAYSTDSEIIPTVRGNGVLVVQAAPSGGVITGQSSVFQLDGWNWEDAVLKADDGIWLDYPPLFSRGGGGFEGPSALRKNENRPPILAELDRTFADALAYTELKNQAVPNLKLEAMRGLFDGSKALYINVDYGRDIIEAVKFAQKSGVKRPVVVGGAQASQCLDFLKENKIPVILGGTHELPYRTDDDVDLPYKLPSILQKAGIQTVISYAGLSWRSRNLPFLAGTAAGFGLDKEEALKMITANPAQILGIADKVGTLEAGKHATLLISKGDLLDMRSSVVERAWIQGRAVDLDDKQKRLYRKFSEKYNLK
ncbi:MAG: amidohydrolase family protein [Cytophagaceae bacterium]|nr:amidohydrolase family protein [Cytophagaceae bacterium]